MAPRPCWAEISLSQLKENLAIIRRHIGPERKVLAVVKADAYGHGARPVSRALEEARVDALGVACVAEGIELRQAGIRAPIVVLTGFFPGEEKDLIAHDITPGITEVGQVERLEKAAGGKRTRIHVKIDTGMGRLGVPCSDIPRLLDWLATSPSLELEGLYTPFASSEDFTSPPPICPPPAPSGRGPKPGVRWCGPARCSTAIFLSSSSPPGGTARPSSPPSSRSSRR